MIACAASRCPDGADPPPEEHQIVRGSTAGIMTPTHSLHLVHIHAQVQAYGADPLPVMHQVVAERAGGTATPAHFPELVCVCAQLQVMRNHQVIHLRAPGKSGKGEKKIIYNLEHLHYEREKQVKLFSFPSLSIILSIQG